MRSLATRLFAATLAVSVVGLAIGVWWVRRAVQIEVDRQVTVQERIVSGSESKVVREVTRDVTVAMPQGRRQPAGAETAVPDALSRRLIAGFSIVILGAAVVTALVSRRLLGPIVSLRAASDRWSRGDFTARVEIPGRDELAALGRAFNEMAERLEAQEQLKRDLTNDVAHELRTPLTNLRCHIEALQDSVVAPGPQTWETLGADVASLERLVRDLGELSQAEARQLPLAPEAVDVRAVFESLCGEMAARATAAGVNLSTEGGQAVPPAWVDRGRLLQVLRNLLANALTHTPPGGRVTLAVARAETGVTVRVSDTGRGIEPAHLPNIFDRFYRADPARSRETGGAGLGLAIARQVVLASGGTIDVESAPGRGTTFVMTLPSAPS